MTSSSSHITDSMPYLSPKAWGAAWGEGWSVLSCFFFLHVRCFLVPWSRVRGGVEEIEKGQSLCTWYGSVLSCLSPEYCISKCSVPCRAQDKSFEKSVGRFLSRGREVCLHWISSSPLTFSPHRKTHRLLLLVHFPAASCRLSAGYQQHSTYSFLPWHALGHRQLMPPYHDRWWVG